ncbi:MAG: MBOAT family protein [Halobacteriovoraceae bacterium]|nr:MBOAT family protein [Halobacteriovoraceae bacterium]MBT5095217.1 MBOAT family protein [Halobacteriovoraceae bacterium]
MALFLPVVVLGYYLLVGRSRQATLLFLVTSSFFFYLYWNWRLGWIIALSIAINYGLGKLIYNKGKAGASKNYLILGVCFNLFLLGYFKYAGFLITNINGLFKSGFTVPQIILPLAISFFTFQQIAYLVDVHRKKVSGGYHSLVDYTFFVAFFPQLIAGPIVHHSDIIPQLADEKLPEIVEKRYENLAKGLSIFLIGLFKKVYIADTLALVADQIFDLKSFSGLTTPTAWIGVLAYSLQLYFDFSGYSDMAIGLGRMLGIKLPINFNSPYKAVSIADFWRRWHITLSTFLRDYLYFSLGGNRVGKIRHNFNLFLTMLLGGLWHGAGWTFVIWGALHGLFLIVNRVFSQFFSGTSFRIPVALSRLLTFICVAIAWTYFRADGISDADQILEKMLFNFNFSSTVKLHNFDWIILVTGLILAFWAPNTAELFSYKETSLKIKKLQWKPNLAWGCFLLFVGFGSFLYLSREVKFIYFQF